MISPYLNPAMSVIRQCRPMTPLHPVEIELMLSLPAEQVAPFEGTWQFGISVLEAHRAEARCK